MVAVHDIKLSEFVDGSIAQSAVAFLLSKESGLDNIRSFSAERWEVQLTQNRKYLVARTSLRLYGADLLDAAIRFADRALDFCSVENGEHLVLQHPADEHIMLSRQGEKSFVIYRTTSDFGMEVRAELTVTRSDGTIDPPPETINFPWAPAFRFYRLSQSSRDLFEAYRNLFLGLEALFDQLFPKVVGESERTWLLRAIREVGMKTDLRKLAIGNFSDPAEELLKNLYEIRVQLFHAKTGRAIIPLERLSYVAVSEAYESLVGLWKETVRAWLSLNQTGSVLTFYGFRYLLQPLLSSLKFAVTPDLTAASREDTKISPLGLAVSFFSDQPKVKQIQSGLICVHAQVEVGALNSVSVIGRIAGMSDDKLALVDCIEGGLHLNGADVFEIQIALRLANRGTPRTEFP